MPLRKRVPLSLCMSREAKLERQNDLLWSSHPLCSPECAAEPHCLQPWKAQRRKARKISRLYTFTKVLNLFSVFFCCLFGWLVWFWFFFWFIALKGSTDINPCKAKGWVWDGQTQWELVSRAVSLKPFTPFRPACSSSLQLPWTKFNC